MHAFLFLPILAVLNPPELRTAREGVEFFEKRIRPVLVRDCFECHSSQAKSLKGGLNLEHRESGLRGGDSGPAIVPGKPTESLLLSALRHDGDVQMPPKGKLPDSVIRDFERWIEMGAPDPRVPIKKSSSQTGLRSAADHWAYRPIGNPIPPKMKPNGCANDGSDAFILDALQRNRLKPSAEAERVVLLRRVHLDLVGLPPTQEELDAFLADDDPAAFEKVVDRLLASPRFGERWGRHWLDVARFAESLTLRGFLLTQAWRYRDYVVASFNEDAPFDRMIREQIAGDLLPGGDWREKQRRLVATSLLMLGDANLEEQDKKQLRMDVVDDQLDVVSKAFLAQTVTCARCHDHKFDPIPTKDYYALAGVFRNVKSMEHANVSKLVERTLPVDPLDERRFANHAERLKSAKDALTAARKKWGGGKSAKGIVAAETLSGIVVDDEQAKRVGDWTHSVHSGTYIERGYLHDADKDKGVKTLTFQPELPATGRYEVRLAYSPGTSRASNVPVTVFSADGETTLQVDMRKPPTLVGRFVSLGTFKFEKTGQGFVIVSNEETKGHVTADAVAFLSEEALADSKSASEGDREIARLESDLKRLESAPEAKRPSIVSPVEETKIEDAHVHIRGSVHSLGESAPRGVLRAALHDPAPTFPSNQSGRKELADWIASRDNPLTARVIVNRVWTWLFGAGLVRSPDNFGTTGETPTHPELLDRLARDFMDDGWSIKRLVRRLVLSRTYRQASSAESPTADPESRWLGRAHRQRLDAEVLRDSMLAAAGVLDQRMGGPEYPPTLAADYGHIPRSFRRSVYLPVFRNALPESLAVVDFADPGAPTGVRNRSTVSTQALYFMNHPFVVAISKRTAARKPHQTNAENITWLYRTLLGRIPNSNEMKIAERAVSSADAASWERLVHALFCSAEFRFSE